MRAALAGIVSVVGLGGLTWWGAENQAPRMEAEIGTAAQAVAETSLHGVMTEASGRDITLSGIVDTEAERDALLAALSEVPGRRKVRDETEVLPIASPYVTEAAKTAEGIAFSGSLPLESLRGTLSESGDANALELQAGAPDSWSGGVQAGLSRLAFLDEGQMRLEDTTLSLTGTVKTPDARDALVSSGSALPDGFDIDVSGIDTLDDGLPPAFSVAHGPNGAVASGKLPEDVSLWSLAQAMGRDAVDGDAAPGLVGKDVGPAARTATEALGLLEEGALDFKPNAVSYSGVARDPAALAQVEDVLAALPDGYAVDTSAVTLLDDGTPPNATISYSAGSGASVSGKLPEGVAADDVAAALGLSGVSGDAVSGLTGGDQGASMKDGLGALAPWLPVVEHADARFDNGAWSLDLAPRNGTDPALVEAALSEALATENVTVGSADTSAAVGDIRVHAATGVNEVFNGYYWLPEVDFDPSEQICSDQTGEALANARVNFLSGSAALEPRSVRVVNRLAAIIAHCVEQSNLKAEVGGHTDSSGDENANYSLSVERAKAVRDALVERGVNAAALSAVGYGQTEPVASNDTEEGRAANRRTTIIWTTIAQ